MSRTRGGRKRSAAPSSGSILFQSFSSAGVRRTSWPGRRTQAPSSATSCGARKSLKHRGKCRRRKARLELQAQPLEPHAGQVRVVGVEALRASRSSARFRRIQAAGETPSVVPAMRIGDAAARRRHRSAEGASARSRANAARSTYHGARSSSAASAASAIIDRVRLELREPLRRAALARGRAQVEEAAAADGALRGGVAQHEAVARRRRDRLVEHELDMRLRAGRERSSPSSTTRAATSVAA